MELVNWNFDLHACILLQTMEAISLSNNIVENKASSSA